MRNAESAAAYSQRDTLTVLASDFARLVAERDQLRVQVTELQAHNTKLVEERRAHLQAQVGAFMRLFNQPTPSVPTIPSAALADFRFRLLDEEVGELRRAFVFDGDDRVRVNMVEAVDAIGDILYVTMGFALALGVDMHPVMAEIQRSNLAKVGGPVANGKQLKPAGWTPPDIAGVLRSQGWVGA